MSVEAPEDDGWFLTPPGTLESLREATALGKLLDGIDAARLELGDERLRKVLLEIWSVLGPGRRT